MKILSEWVIKVSSVLSPSFYCLLSNQSCCLFSLKSFQFLLLYICYSLMLLRCLILQDILFISLCELCYLEVPFWCFITISYLSLQDHRSLKEPTRLFERMVVVGLHPNCDIKALERQCFARKSEFPGKLRSARNYQNYSRVEPDIEPQVGII